MRRILPIGLGFALLVPVGAWAHCDRIDGPVATAARAALASGEVAAVSIWVGVEQEAELVEAFARAAEAARAGGAGAALAERYLVETAVRLHRAAEGLPFDGVRPADSPMPADIELAEQALATGNLAEVTADLSEALEGQVRPLFEAVRREAARRDASVADGRRWVDAYVRYVGFVHALHAAIEAGPEHGVGHAE